MDTADVTRQYMEQTIFLFIGGFFLAFAMEKWNIHQRLSFSILLRTGGSPVRVLAGIMLTTFFISMWISNTATTLMMLTAVLAILKHDHLFPPGEHRRMSTGLLLALTYTASIGGLCTIVGTPTNMILVGFTDKMYPLQNPVNFTSWFSFGFPFAVLMAIMAFLLIRWRYFPRHASQAFDLDFIREEKRSLGAISYEEKSVLFVFGLTVLLWFTRVDIDFNGFMLHGWSSFVPHGRMIKDSTVVIFSSLLLFLWPAKSDTSSTLLTWSDVNKLPFRIILLFGSGFALAEAFQVSGLAQRLSGELNRLQGFQPWMFVLCLAALITVMSEFASNVATIQLMLPIIPPVAQSLHVDPLFLMIPATVAASFGYMMPVATAPNTIVYGTGHVPVKDMMRTGLWLNVMGVVLLTAYVVIRKKLS